ncbi:heme ABC exporter ATP-binding protein CcmA [Acetobacter ghanensis]|uniref:heme ABC exporter ATP-binding protein CcmA n=1 Tax=Acetobacter ghanensis TaxID=431306 RepID=UPI002156E433|nr:heme exporter ATP-binding protein A [Acetobacter ghanensis DSM 18895]
MSQSSTGANAAPAPALATAPLLAADSLCIFRGDRLVLDGVSLRLNAGDAMLLTGPNGAGKSTLLRVLAGLRKPDSGLLTWNGQSIFDDRAAHAERVAYIGHQDALKPGLTVTENLRLFTRPGANMAEALEAMDLLPLANLPARLLSAGQKRRTALARVLLAQAPLWLLDEPSLGLDSAAITLLGNAMTAHRARGGMLIATTHVPLPLDNSCALALPGATDHRPFAAYEEGDGA